MNQDDNGITKLGCVNHDCDKCKAQQQEPVACVHIKDGCLVGSHRDGSKLFPDGQYGLWPIDNSPAQRTWVGLTKEEILEINDTVREQQGWLAFVRAIEAKLKEKNGQI